MGKRYYIREFVFQIIPVAIGVFLGFLVSNWTESRKENERSKNLKESLIAELTENKALIKQVQKYHVMLRDTTRYFASNNKGITNPSFFKGVNLWSLTDSAYETSIQTGIINTLPLQEIQEINKAYTLQDRYNEFSTLVITGLMSIDIGGPNKEEKSKAARFLSITMTDVVIKEKELIEQYNKLLRML